MFSSPQRKLAKRTGLLREFRKGQLQISRIGGEIKSFDINIKFPSLHRDPVDLSHADLGPLLEINTLVCVTLQNCTHFGESHFRVLMELPDTSDWGYTSLSLYLKGTVASGESIVEEIENMAPWHAELGRRYKDRLDLEMGNPLAHAPRSGVLW